MQDDASPRDAADYNEASAPSDLLDAIEPTPETGRILAREIAAGLVAMLIDAPNPRLRIIAIAHAFGLPTTMGRSERWWAAQINVTPAALCKEVIALREKYGVPCVHGGKTEQARRKLSIAHHKSQLTPAT